MPTPKFLFFDLGMVLVTFSMDRMVQQIEKVAGVPQERVREVLFTRGLQVAHETGLFSTREFYQRFQTDCGVCCDQELLARATSDIFTLHVPMIPLVAQLRAAGWRMGILSNTFESHWLWCYKQWPLLRDHFDVYALSYELKACKPDPALYQRAAELAGVKPAEIFFTDDLPRHIEAARQAGWDGEPFVSASQLAAALRRRGLRFNY